MSNDDRISSRGKIGLLFIILVGGFGIAILWSSIKVTWIDGDTWRSRAEKLTHNTIPQKANRGNIYSSDGKILATTVPECDLYLDFSRRILKDNKGNPVLGDEKPNGRRDTLRFTPIHDTNYTKYVDSVCEILHQVFPDTSAATFRKIIDGYRNAEKPRGCVCIKRHLPYSDWDRICKYPGWRRGVVKYVDGKSVIHNRRFHTYGNMGESVVGMSASYLDEKWGGLEGHYDSILRGRDGRVLCRRLTWGSWIPVGRGTNIAVSESDSVRTDSIPGHPVINGKHIVSTIDSRLQDIAHYSLQRTLRRFGSSAGCAILIEAETGNVLVCSSLILDTTGLYLESPYRNVAVTDLYEPGSIFKPVILTAMYNDPSFTLDTSMMLPVGTKTFSRNSKMVEDHGIPNGQYPLWKAVAVSSNVAFCELAWRYYQGRRDSLFAQVSRIFPFEKLNLDMKMNEYKSKTHPLTYDNDFLRFCYGYTISVSPMRMATFYNAIANKGRMVKPRFCKGMIDNGEFVEFPVEVIKEQICSKQTAETLRDLLIGVVEGGTGDNIKNDTYAIAGKTGTAVTSPNAPTSNATFVGFFPADKPKYTCLVMMRDIRSFGRQAAPVFQDIADCVVALDKELDCRPTIKHIAEKRQQRKDSKSNSYTLPTVSKAPQAELRLVHKKLGLDYSNVTMQSTWATFREPVDSLNLRAAYIPYQIPQKQVPNCYGMTIKDAILLCRSMGLDVSFEGSGKVVSQEPKARTPITNGTKVHLKLSSEK